MKRLPFTDAFVDESIRGRRYLMACVLVAAKDLAPLRVEVESLVLTGRRVHFHNESKARRRVLLSEFSEWPISTVVTVCHRGHGTTEYAARAQCLGTIVERIQADGVPHLVLESRQDDRDDHRTIQRTRRSAPPLVWDHRAPAEEPLLWIADGIAWAAGAGGTWRELIAPIVEGTIELHP